jgi:hypothetical protein
MGTVLCSRTRNHTDFLIVLSDGQIRIFLQHVVCPKKDEWWYCKYGGENKLVAEIPIALPTSIDLMMIHLQKQYYCPDGEPPQRLIFKPRVNIRNGKVSLG